MLRFPIPLFLAGLVLPAAAQSRPAPTRIEVAPGIHLFQTEPYGDAGLDGNSVAIVSTDGVLVFDANGTPAAAAAVLAEIRRITDQPVRYLVLSHWHWDHWYGAEVYREAFPNLVIVSQEKTRVLMAGPAIAFNQPGLDVQLPGHIDEVDAARAKASDTSAARLERHVAADRWFLAQKRSVHHTLATLTFTDSLTIHLGEREIRLRHHDRAITPGDTYLYLPNDRVVITGDLLINPITFALFCYPAGWIATLDQIARLDFATLIPGHGAPLRDRTLLAATTDLLRREYAVVRDTRGGGGTVDQARATVLADSAVRRLRGIITGGDARMDPAFDLYLVDGFVRRAWQELAGPLDDSIPATP
ncbi:MAG: MBL fold metallo-hydrolase [Gemmatimonadales bacterium]